MSRKTRQEKIIADLRRRLAATKVIKPEAKHEEETLPPSPQPTTNLTTQYSPSISTSYIKKDLTKTAILTILAISLELVLYFLTRVGRF